MTGACDEVGELCRQNEVSLAFIDTGQIRSDCLKATLSFEFADVTASIIWAQICQHGSGARSRGWSGCIYCILTLFKKRLEFRFELLAGTKQETFYGGNCRFQNHGYFFVGHVLIST